MHTNNGASASVSKENGKHFHGGCPKLNVKMTVFDEKESPKTFWNTFQSYVEINHMTDAEAIAAFPFYLQQNQKEWFFQLPEQKRVSLDALKLAFLDRFKPQVPFNIEIWDLTQQTNETVETYIQRVRQLATDSGVQEDFLTARTMRGMLPRIATIVMPQSPATMEELRQKGNLAEITVRVTSQGERQPATVNSMAPLIDITARMQENIIAAISDGFARRQDDEETSHRQAGTGRQRQRRQYQQSPQNAHPGGQQYGAQHPSGQQYGAQHPGGQQYGAQHPGGQQYGAQHPGGQQYGAQHPGGQQYGAQHPGGQQYGAQYPGGQQHPGGQQYGAQFQNQGPFHGNMQGPQSGPRQMQHHGQQQHQQFQRAPKGKKCFKCGNLSCFTKQCPAKYHRCSKCGLIGHFERICLNTLIESLNNNNMNSC